MIARKVRPWVCKHCPQKNEPTARKCVRCGIGKTTKRTSLKAWCDDKARWLCKWLAGFKCQYCGTEGTGDHRTDGLDWAHIKVRRHHSIRWSMLNCVCLCRKCHDYFGTREFEWMKFVDRLKGAGTYEALEQMANEPWDKDYAKIKAYLTGLLKGAA